MEKLINKHILVIIATFQLVLFLVIKNDPFHGDAVTSTARATLHIYNNDLKTIWYPPSFDPGHPTLFPYLLAILWTIFGKSLLISHLFILIISFFILLVTRKIALHYCHETKANIATLLAGSYAIFVAQEALLLNTPLFYLFVLLAFYNLLKQHKTGFVISTVLMELTHLQANFFLLAFGIIYCYQTFKNKETIAQFFKNGIILFLPALVTLSVWIYAHHLQFGWAFLSPNYAEHNDVKGLKQFIQSVFLIIWRLVDNGMITVYILIIYLIFKQKLNKELFIFSAIILVINSLCMAIFLYNTIGHRYFMISQFMFIILLIEASSKKQFKSVVSLAILSLIFGNFMYYPGKVIADTNLQYRNFFSLEKQVKHHFDSIPFYSYAPISASSNIRYLAESKGLKISSLNDLNFDTIPAILQSNVNAEFSKPQRDYLYKNWYGNSYENGAVYVNVFLNPTYYKKPSWFKLRKPSFFEQKLLEIKYKIRGE
jgi:hypothetical protein